MLEPHGRGPAWNYHVVGEQWDSQAKAWRAAREDPTSDMLASKMPTQPERLVETTTFDLILHSASNCVSRLNLRHLQNLESELYNHSGYSTFYCQLVGEPATCRKPASILRLFDGTYAGLNVMAGVENVFRPDPDFERIEEILATAYDANGNSPAPNLITAGQPYLRDVVEHALDSSYEGGQPMAKHCRMTLHFGTPLAGYRTHVDRAAAQLEAMANWLEAHWHRTLNDKRVGDMNIAYHSEPLQAKLRHNEFHDASRWLGFGLAVLFLSLLAGTRTFLVGVFGCLHVVGSSAWALFLHRVVFGFYAWDMPQLMANYVAAALGASTVLLMTHALRRLLLRTSSIEDAGGLLYRSAIAHCTTSGVATALSFFVAAASRITEVRSMALLCGCMATTNMISALVFIPPMLLCWASLASNASVAATANSSPSSARNSFVTFLYSRVVGHRGGRWVITAVFTVTVVVFLTIAVVHVKVDTQQPQVWRSTSPLQTHRKEVQRFAITNTSSTVYVVFGVQAFRDSCHSTDQLCNGRITYRDAFDLNFATLQRAVKAFCDGLFALDEEHAQRLNLGRNSRIDPITNAGHLLIDCPLQDLASYTVARGYGFPVLQSSLAAIMAAHPTTFPPAVYNSTAFNPPVSSDTFYRFFESAALDWLVQGNDRATANHVARFAGLVGGKADATQQLRTDGSLAYAGDFGDQLRFVAIRVQLSLNAQRLDPDIGRATLAAWEALIAESNAELPAAVTPVFQTNGPDRTWQWLRVQAHLESDVSRNLIVSALASSVLMAVSLNNWATPLMSFIFTGLVVTMVFGIYGLLGWNLDLNSAVSLVVVVPLVGDYLGRMVYLYVACKSSNREARVLYALAAAGEPVFTSACGVLLAATWVFGTEDFFAYHFGITLMTTLGMTVLFGLLFFLAVLHIFGPERHEGTLALPWFQTRSARVSPTSLEGAEQEMALRETLA